VVSRTISYIVHNVRDSTKRHKNVFLWYPIREVMAGYIIYIVVNIYMCLYFM